MFHFLFVWVGQMSCQYNSYIVVEIWMGGWYSSLEEVGEFEELLDEGGMRRNSKFCLY
jgi:hypothetical protein